MAASGLVREHIEDGAVREHIEDGAVREHFEDGAVREHAEDGATHADDRTVVRTLKPAPPLELAPVAAAVINCICAAAALLCILFRSQLPHSRGLDTRAAAVSACWTWS